MNIKRRKLWIAPLLLVFGAERNEVQAKNDNNQGNQGTPRIGNTCAQSVIRYGPKCLVRQGVGCLPRVGPQCQPTRFGANCVTRIGAACNSRAGSPCLEIPPEPNN